MHLHILGICGTFMAGLAQLARQLGHQVSGSDEHVYPPMSDQLRAAAIDIHEGYDPDQFEPVPDLVVIGNALSRGNPAVEYVLDNQLPYTSGPDFLARHILQGRWVLAVAGTHGKTTTSSMLAWILDDAGLDPGFLIGGVPDNFSCSARLGSTPFFVIEADEYDSAFFDKRSKFIHYRSRTTVINNIEFDHADIFPDLAAIQRQFHHLVRTLPGNGLLITASAPGIDEVLAQGCWTPVERVLPEVEEGSSQAGWRALNRSADLHGFDVHWGQQAIGRIDWRLQGQHNIANALAAIAAARHAGVPPKLACEALASFSGVKRRMEKIACIAGRTLYDDFAHHPTAIASTLDGLRRQAGDTPVTTILELRSNTMKAGIHRQTLPAALQGSDRVILFESGDMDWSLAELAAAIAPPARVCQDIDEIITTVTEHPLGKDENIVIMSNGGFSGLHQKLIKALQAYEK